jgi:hypothetical protein
VCSWKKGELFFIISLDDDDEEKGKHEEKYP